MSEAATSYLTGGRTQGTSLAEQAYDAVERMIVTLDLAPGSVFTEAELAESIGIGRTPLREALQRLAAAHLVQALPRRGMLVSEINASEYLNLLDTRGVLDRLIAVQAARRADPNARTALRACAAGFGEVAETRDESGFLMIDRHGDALLESASHNPYASQAVSPLHAHCRRFWTVHRHHGDLGESAVLHAQIMLEVANGNENGAGQACDALIAYLESFARRALDL